ETAATLFIGGALLLLAARVGAEAAGRSGRAAEAPAIGMLNWAVMIATLAVNFFVSTYEAREGRRLGSSYLVADAAPTRSDLLVSRGVIVCFALGLIGLRRADAVVAVAIALVIAWQALRILIGAFDVLTDRAVLAPETIARCLAAVPEVAAVRDIRTRGAK